MDAPRFDRFTAGISAHLTRRTGLGLLAGASLPLLRLSGDADAKKKKKVTLCVNGQTVKAPKKKAKKLLQQGATKGACGAGCPDGQRVCGSGCIPAGDCCVDDDCNGNDVCVNGACVACPAGQKACDTACIPLAACCVSNDCPGNDFCVSGTCVSFHCGNGGPCVVFQASGILGSVLNGLAGADQFCMNNAATNPALLGRQFKAWLSGGGQSPSTRFTNRANAGPYVLVGNASDNGNPPPTVASSFAALTSCDNDGVDICIQHIIDRNALGSNNAPSAFVWTGTREDGTGDTFTCDVWSDDGPTNEGLIGETTKTTSSWTASNFQTCSGSVNGVYCFEQAT